MILVVGGNGYLGRSFCQTLVQQGEQIISLDITSANTEQYTSIVADVRNRKELEKVFDQYPITTVVNFAAILVSQSTSNPLLSFQVNVVGNYNLLELCREHGISKFVFSSSYAVFGIPTENTVDETDETSPPNFYSETKVFIESLGMSFSQLSGFQFIVGRLPLLVGSGEPTATSPWRANMFNLLSTGGNLSFDYAPDQILPLVHYDDAAEALAVLTTQKNLHHHLYHLPYENWRLDKLERLLTSLNPSLKVTFGNRKFESVPKDISFNRFTEEFDFHQPSLRKQLEKTTQ